MACKRGTWADAGFTENSHWVLVYHIFHRNTVWTFSEILKNCSSFWMWFLRSHFHFSELFRIAQGEKRSTCNAGDLVSVPGLGRSLGDGNTFPRPYSGLENSMDRAVWQAIVHGVAKSLDTLSNFHFHSVSTSLSSQRQLPEHWQHSLSLSLFSSWAFWYSVNHNSYGKMLFFSSQNSYLENSMHRGVWQAIVHGVAKS